MSNMFFSLSGRHWLLRYLDDTLYLLQSHTNRNGN